MFASPTNLSNLLVLTYYSPRGGSSRYMIHDYLPYLDQTQIPYTVVPLLDDWYLAYILDQTRPVGKEQLLRYLLQRYFLRLKALLHSANYQTIIFDTDLWPYLPYFLSRLFLRRPYIVHYDEAHHTRYAHHPNRLLRWLNHRKIERVIQRAHHVVAWNPIVAEYARQINPHVTELGLGIDLERYRPKTDYEIQERPFRIGWIGTPSGYRYLHQIGDVLRQLSQAYDIELSVISSQPFELEGVRVINRPWSLATEVDDLLTLDVGIMPLPETEWASGKSGCKMLQYMGVSVPTIVSPVGINATVIQHNHNGLTAATSPEWYEAFERLLVSAELRQKLGRAGRAYVETHNNQAQNAQKLIQIIQQINSP